MGPLKRLRKELQALERAPDADIDLQPQQNDIRRWQAVIRGPGETPFEGGTFQLLIETGEICLDILKKEWSPAWSLQAACRAVMALLAAPDADSPLNCDAGNMVRAGDMRAFNSLAKMYTAEYASVDLSLSS
ncbi:hypothetical protein VYU27_004465 [Nannochloropsis oceanica]